MAVKRFYFFGSYSSSPTFRPFIMEVESDNNGVFTIPTTGGGYNYDVKTSDGQTFTGVTGNLTITFPSQNTRYDVEISGDFPRIYFANGSERLKVKDIKQWGDIVWLSMDRAFYGCANLQVSATDVPDLSSVTAMDNMFRDCTSLTTLDVSAWDVSNVTNMSVMFYQCSSLATLDVSNWDVSSVTNMSNMFYQCSSLATLDVSNWDVSSVTNMSVMFYQCSSLTTLDVSAWDVSSVTNMSNMFYQCTSLATLDVSAWDVSSVTNMNRMFQQCSSLTTLDVSNWDVSSVTNMGNMFYQCTNFISDLDFSDATKGTINVKAIGAIVGTYDYSASAGARVLKLQAGSITPWTPGFYGQLRSNKIEVFELIGMSVSFDIQYFPLLLGAELDNLFTSIGIASSGETITISTAQSTSGIDTTIATNKGWTIVIV